MNIKSNFISILLSLIIFLSGCTSLISKNDETPNFNIDPNQKYNLYDPGYIPHFADTGLSIYSLTLGGVELNPFGFPMAVVAKVVYETAAYQYKRAGRPDICYVMATSARVGSSMGFGGTLGSLVFGGMTPLVAGALIAGAVSFHFAKETAKDTCFGKGYLFIEDPNDLITVPLDTLDDNNNGFGNK